MVNREFAEWRCRILDEYCYITDDEEFWKRRDLKQVIAMRDPLLYSRSRIDNLLNGVKDNDEELLLRCFNFIVRTVRFLNVPVENWKYGLRKYREKRCIYNYIYTESSIIIIGQQPSSLMEVNIYDVNSYAGQLLISYLPPIDKSKYFEDFFWENCIRIDEYPGILDPNETIKTICIKLKYGEN
jgi:hypothetical protein